MTGFHDSALAVVRAAVEDAHVLDESPADEATRVATYLVSSGYSLSIPVTAASPMPLDRCNPVQPTCTEPHSGRIDVVVSGQQKEPR